MGLQLLDVAQFRALIASLPTSKTSSPLPCIPALPAPPEPTPFSPTLNPPSKSLKREGEGDAISATLSPKRARKADPVPEPLPEPEQKCSPSFGCVCAGSGACHLARSGLCFSQTQAVSAWRLWGGAKEEAKRYKGVRMRSPGRWTAELKDVRRGIRLWLGTHCSPEKAAQAYDNAARKLYGVAARTNFGKAMEGEVRREVYVQVGPAGRTVGEGGGGVGGSGGFFSEGGEWVQRDEVLVGGFVGGENGGDGGVVFGGGVEGGEGGGGGEEGGGETSGVGEGGGEASGVGEGGGEASGVGERGGEANGVGEGEGEGEGRRGGGRRGERGRRGEGGLWGR